MCSFKNKHKIYNQKPSIYDFYFSRLSNITPISLFTITAYLNVKNYSDPEKLRTIT
jgi:hypothetical protein